MDQKSDIYTDGMVLMGADHAAASRGVPVQGGAGHCRLGVEQVLDQKNWKCTYLIIISIAWTYEAIYPLCFALPWNENKKTIGPQAITLAYFEWTRMLDYWTTNFACTGHGWWSASHCFWNFLQVCQGNQTRSMESWRKFIFLTGKFS